MKVIITNEWIHGIYGYIAAIEFISSDIPDDTCKRQAKNIALKEWDDKRGGPRPKVKKDWTNEHCPDFYFFSIDSLVDCDSWDSETREEQVIDYFTRI